MRLCIIGGTGFVGQHLLRVLLDKQFLEIKMLSRQVVVNSLNSHQVQWLVGDLLQVDTLNTFIEPGSVVINLAYLSQASEAEQLLAAKNLAQVCVEKKIKRLIHLSTAVLAGKTSAARIDEDSQLVPSNEYELNKFRIEQLLLGYANKFEVAILRPTAVFGAHGKNLRKLLAELSQRRLLKNYLKACILSHRKMNLVYVENVVAAIVFLVVHPSLGNNQVFIISDDEDRENNYRDVADYVTEQLRYATCKLPVIALPQFLLCLMFRVLGKNSPRKIYIGKNLQELGFVKPVSFKQGLKQFTDGYLSQKHESSEC